MNIQYLIATDLSPNTSKAKLLGEGHVVVAVAVRRVTGVIVVASLRRRGVIHSALYTSNVDAHQLHGRRPRRQRSTSAGVPRPDEHVLELTVSLRRLDDRGGSRFVFHVGMELRM